MANISHLAPIIAVSDMERSLDFYQKIGFQAGFLWETPPTYAVLSVGDTASIHLSLLDLKDQDKGNSTFLYLFVHDVDEIYQLCQAHAFSIRTPIGDRDYQMRDFELEDPDGNVLVLGKSLALH